MTQDAGQYLRNPRLGTCPNRNGLRHPAVANASITWDRCRHPPETKRTGERSQYPARMAEDCRYLTGKLSTVYTQHHNKMIIQSSANKWNLGDCTRGVCALFATFLLFFFLNPASEAEPRPPALRVLILDGASVEIYHSWELTTTILKAELESTGRFDVTVLTAPPFGQNFGGFDPHFERYQAVVWNYDAPDWPLPLQTELQNYLGDGGGMVIVHAADNSFPHWGEFNKMIGIGGWRDRDEHAGPMWHYDQGKLTADNSPGAAGKHGRRLPFLVKTRAPQDPIMRGIPTEWMHTPDELYGTLRGPGENMTVLATAHSDPANQGTGFDEPILMTIRYGKGRVFHTVLGHNGLAMSCVGFATTFERGTEWAASGRVTLPIPRTFPTANTASYRVDLAMKDPAFAVGIQTVANQPPAATKP